MAGFTSFASTAMQVLSVANTVAKGIDTYKDDSGQRSYDALKKQSAAQLQALQANNALKKQAIDLDLQTDEDKRRRAVLAAIAKQKAAFGASGVGSSGGSAQAYLLGLTEENEDITRDMTGAAAIQKNILDQNLASQQRLNTLSLTEAKEKNRLKRATSLYDTVSGGFGGLGGNVLVDSDGFYS
jgi:hypothetical protein